MTGAETGGLLDNRRLMGFAFLAPAVVYIALLIGVPFVTAFAYSPNDATVGNTSFRYAGLRNFETVLNAPDFHAALRNTFVFTLVAQVFVLILANMLALILTAPLPQNRLVRHVGRATAADHAVGDPAGAVRDRLAVDVRLIKGTLYTVAVLLFCIVAAAPLLVMGITTFQTDRDLYKRDANPFDYAEAPTLEHLDNLFNDINYLVFIRNSLVVGAAVVAITLLLALPAGYSLVRLTGRWANAPAS